MAHAALGDSGGSLKCVCQCGVQNALSSLACCALLLCM